MTHEHHCGTCCCLWDHYCTVIDKCDLPYDIECGECIIRKTKRSVGPVRKPAKQVQGENMKTTKVILSPNVNVGGTHLQGTLYASYEMLVQVFGEPIENDYEKTPLEWRGIINGDPFTIYEYQIDPGTPGKFYTDRIHSRLSWRIGGKDHRVAEAVKQYFNEQVGKVKIGEK